MAWWTASGRSLKTKGNVPAPPVRARSAANSRPSSFSRLYRGISAPILMEAPKRATKFAANDEWGKIYRNLFGLDKMTQPLSVLTGASAGATESFVVVPFELVKIRLQDKASAGKYNGALDVVFKTVKNEGVLSLYQGLESTMWRHVLWNAGYFGCIFQVRQFLPKAETKSKQMTNDLLSGSVGGTVGTILNTPMDVVKSRIQNTPRVPGQVPKYNWAWASVFTVAREEGFGALYKGFLPKVGPPSSDKRKAPSANPHRFCVWVPEVVFFSSFSLPSWTPSAAGRNRDKSARDMWVALDINTYVKCRFRYRQELLDLLRCSVLQVTFFLCLFFI